MLAAALTAFGIVGGQALAASCAGRDDALGTSRILSVNTSGGLEVGTKSYPGTLPLQAKEVVLTFDDGPAGETTDRVLAALAAECVRATFFVVGRQAAAYPAQLKRLAAAGHTVAHHSHTHPIMRDVPFEKAKADIERGWRTVDGILSGDDSASPRVPFFRFPGFAPTPELSSWLASRRIGVFGADLWGSDWTPTSSEALLAQVLGRLEARGGGILLLHDTHRHTADMVPRLLRELSRRGFRIVHIVPAPR